MSSNRCGTGRGRFRTVNFGRRRSHVRAEPSIADTSSKLQPVRNWQRVEGSDSKVTRSATLRRAEVHSRVPACLCSFAQVNPLPPALGRLLSHEVSPTTQRTVLECIVRTVRSCSTASFEEPATGTMREQREVVSRGLISDTALVLGETLRSCSTVFPGECEREVISRVLASNNRPVLECLGRPCSKITTSRFGRELE